MPAQEESGADTAQQLVDAAGEGPVLLAVEAPVRGPVRDQNIRFQRLQVSGLFPELTFARLHVQLEGQIPRGDGPVAAQLRVGGDRGAPDPQPAPGGEVQRYGLQGSVQVLDPEVAAQLLSVCRPQLLQYEVVVPGHQHQVLVGLTAEPLEAREHVGARLLKPRQESLEVLVREALRVIEALSSALVQKAPPFFGPGFLVAQVPTVHQYVSGRKMHALVQQVGVTDGH
mmetsp:Transcript_76996/g.184482  ORF Transcript_76996/g.184482 Transcript_76996/m.184482 type:complete len:228 (+) Transcript_76996:228-911(+)